MINFDKTTNTFYLNNKRISYVIHINEYKMLIKLYFGKSIDSFSLAQIESIQNIYADTYSYLDLETNKEVSNPKLDPFSILSEVPSNLRNDKREPLCIISHFDNSSVTDFRYHSHKIYQENR